MIVTRRSMLSGEYHEMDLDVTEHDLFRWKQECLLVQDVFPHLSADEREFLMTGITPEEWNEAFGGDDAYQQD